MSWTLDGFEKAVRDAVKERTEQDEFLRKAIPEGKAALIESVQKFAKDTKEYWEHYCNILSKAGYAHLANTSYVQNLKYEHFEFMDAEAGTLHIIRVDENIRFYVTQSSCKSKQDIIFVISLEGDKVVTEFNSEINLPMLYYWKDSINDDLQAVYLGRLVDRVRGIKHEKRRID